MESKDLLLSKSFWGAMVMGLGMILAKYGIDINVSETASAIVTLIGLVMNVAGIRYRKGPIHSVLGVKIKPAATVNDVAPPVAAPADKSTAGGTQ
jgi:uncharacterized membrane protein